MNPPRGWRSVRAEARGSRTREPRGGDADAVFCGRRGTPLRIALSGRERRRRERSEHAPNPRGKKKQLKPVSVLGKAGVSRPA